MESTKKTGAELRPKTFRFFAPPWKNKNFRLTKTAFESAAPRWNCCA
jgi:hypothetical protein